MTARLLGGCLALLALGGCGSGQARAPDAAVRAVCGDGRAQPGEDCDGTDLGGKTCADFGFDSGQLTCHPTCVLDVRGCATVELCDNGKDDDGNGLVDCADPGCADSAACAVCGDGRVTGAESCDDGNTVAGDCCDHCRAESGCELERNDTLATAMKLALDTSGQAAVRGNLVPAGDVDVFAVTIPAGSVGTLTAETHAFAMGGSCAGAADTVIELLDATGAVVAADEDSGEATCSLASRAGLAPGIAAVRVKASPLALFPIFGYRLTVQLALAPCGDGVIQAGEECDDGNARDGDGCSSACRLEPKQETEPDDLLAAANGPYAPPFAVLGSVDAPQADDFDSDWYAFDLAASASLRIETFDAADPDCSTVLAAPELYDAGGALLQESSLTDLAPQSCGRILTGSLAPSRYYVKVAGRPSPAAYTLYVVHAGPAPR